VTVSGRITIDSSPDLRILLLRRLGTADCDSLTVDLHDVPYMDMSGLAILLEILKAARRLNKTFHLSGLRDRPRYLLEAARLLPLFDEVAREERHEESTRR
jgi:anti-anti-sigma factor